MSGSAIDRFIAQPRAAPDGAPQRRSWVYRQVLDAIRDGVLPAGTRLPSARTLADAWDLPRGAVDDAYAQLQAEGLIERRVGSGSHVALRLPALPGQVAQAVASDQADAADAATRGVLLRLRALLDQGRMSTPITTPITTPTDAAQGAPEAGPVASAMRLRTGMPDTASFPLALWRRELASALAEAPIDAMSYGVPAGLAVLRQATARHLSLTRAMRCRPEQVMIIGSPRQGIELMARVLLTAGETVCVEDPGPLSITRSFSLPHLNVVGVPPDAEGFDVRLARGLAPNAAAAVVQPLHQWPTGVRISSARRQQLLDWSEQSGTWIVELDSLGEIVHDRVGPPPLHCSDRAGRVLFLGSFGALTFPALRLAYLVLPESLIDVFAAVRGLMGEHSSVAMQMALAGFIDAGHLGRHVRAVRKLYRERRDALVHAVARHLPPGARLGPVDGGTHASLHLDLKWSDVAVAARLNALGLAVQPLSRHTWEPRGLNGLLLGYGADDEAQIDAAMAALAAVLAAMLRAGPRTA